jgi:hypothetical protein
VDHEESVFCLVLASLTCSSAAHSQVTVDMARVTCAEYLALSAADSAVFSAWMSGWFNQKTGYVFVDLNAYARNVANVKAWCTSNPTQTVMAGLQRHEPVAIASKKRVRHEPEHRWQLLCTALHVHGPGPSAGGDRSVSDHPTALSGAKFQMVRIGQQKFWWLLQ